MVKLNKIYTRNGDQGETHLVGGTVVKKHSLRVETYGEIDELNSYIGLIRSYFGSESNKDKCSKILKQIQNELFDIGSILASDPKNPWEGLPQIKNTHIERLEHEIDFLNKELPELKSFVLPGGSITNAHLHIARSICRRAERKISKLIEQEANLAQEVLIYINRLSDLLFVMARWDAKLDAVEEFLWIPGGEAA